MKLRAVPLSLLVSFALLILAGTAVLASIDETDGAMEEVEPPSSVEPDEFDSDDTIFLFEEQTDVVLSSDLDVDIKNPGTFDWTKLVTPVDGGTILAGTSVHSYFIHFDPASDGGAEPLTGSVTFDTDILGLIVLNAALNDSDPILGAQNEEEPTIYPTGDPGRRMELDCCADPENFDVVFLSSDRRTVEVTVFTDNDSVDQIRVVTAAEQGPPPTPEVPDRPAFSLDTPLPTEDACLCMPPFMVVPDDGIHTWWVRTDGGELRITPIAVGVNILEIGDLNFEVFDPADNSVASRTITYVGLGAESERAGADVVISGTADGDLYRVEVTLTPPSPGTPTAHHYRLETKGASLIGANSPLQTQAEPIPTAWVLNVLDGGSGPEDLDVLVAASPLAPATSGTVEVRDPSGTLVHTGTLGTPIHLTGGPAGQWTVTVLDADGHYVVDKTTGVDRGVYLNWKSFGTGTLTVNPLQLGLPYLGLYKVRIEDVESGMVRHEPPGPAVQRWPGEHIP